VRDEDDTDVETLDGDQVVEVTDAEIAAETRIGDGDIAAEVTKPHDGGEWLTGFNKGVLAGRNDYEQALKAVLGDGPFFDDIAQKVRLVLAGGT
jgi:hypothetical protein